MVKLMLCHFMWSFDITWMWRHQLEICVEYYKIILCHGEARALWLSCLCLLLFLIRGTGHVHSAPPSSSLFWTTWVASTPCTSSLWMPTSSSSLCPSRRASAAPNWRNASPTSTTTTPMLSTGEWISQASCFLSPFCCQTCLLEANMFVSRYSYLCGIFQAIF